MESHTLLPLLGKTSSTAPNPHGTFQFLPESSNTQGTSNHKQAHIKHYQFITHSLARERRARHHKASFLSNVSPQQGDAVT